MGKTNTALKNMFSIKSIFSDLINGLYFAGNDVVHPCELEQIDTAMGLIIQGSDAKKNNVERIRDLAMRWKSHMDVILYFVEFQDKVHYGMPVKNMLYDGLSYLEQMKNCGMRCRRMILQNKLVRQICSLNLEKRIN